MQLRFLQFLVLLMALSYGLFNMARWFYLSINDRDWQSSYWIMFVSLVVASIMLVLITRKK